MDKKILIPTILFAIIFPVSVYVLAQEKDIKQQTAAEQNNPANADLVLYFSDQCPHCKLVEKFITDNGIDSKIIIAQKNVRTDAGNLQELRDKFAACGESGDLAVPLLWDGSNGGNKCIEGDAPIIQFLKDKTNTK
jgi:glutaredoxin